MWKKCLCINSLADLVKSFKVADFQERKKKSRNKRSQAFMIRSYQADLQRMLEHADALYQHYNFSQSLVAERLFFSQTENITPNKVGAFTIANKAEDALEKGCTDDAETMAYHAIKIDPECFDAWRVLCRLMTQFSDNETVISSLREILAYAQEYFKNEFKVAGVFFSITQTRPYMRLLFEIADNAQMADRYDIAIYAYEEMLRLNHNDNMQMRRKLLGAYLKCMGKAIRGDLVYPERDYTKISYDLIYAVLDRKENKSIWGDHAKEVLLRWSLILLMYTKNDPQWEEIVEKEFNLNEWAFKLMFHELDDIPPTNIKPNIKMNQSTDQEMTGVISDSFKSIMIEWPELVIKIHDKYRKPNKNFNDYINSVTPNLKQHYSEENKLKMKESAMKLLDKGRKLLTERNYSESLKYFSMAKQYYVEISYPSKRWYIDIPYAIISNRATAACYIGRWNEARVDSRFTLLIKPDHIRTYGRLPKLAKAFFSPNLEELFNDMLKSIKDQANISENDWNTYSKRAIGLLSLKAIIKSRLHKLSESEIDGFIQTGIEDAFTPVNVSSEQHPLLPWQTDLESCH